MIDETHHVLKKQIRRLPGFSQSGQFKEESAAWISESFSMEAILPVTPEQVLPACVTGKRACPPEGVGGAWGYGALLEAMKNPRHPERVRFARLIESYKPEASDLVAANKRLQALK